MPGQMAVPDNQVLSYSDALAKLAPLILGSGKTTTTESESGSVSPGSQAANDALLQQLMPQISGTAATDPVVANILSKAQQAFAPVIAGQNSAGLYNSTTLQQLRDNATARATGEASAAVLQHQTEAANISQRAIAANMAATRSQTGAKASQTGSILSPQLLASLGTSLFGKSALNYAKKQLGLDDAASTAKDLGPGNIGSTVDSSGAAGSDVGFDAFGNPTSSTGGVTSNGGVASSIGDASTADVGGSLSSEATSAALSADAVGAESLDSIIASSNAALGEGATFGSTDAYAAGLDSVGAFSAEGGVALAGAGFGDIAGGALGADAAFDAALGTAIGGGAAEAGAGIAAAEGAGVAAEAAGGFEAADAAIAIAAWVICTEAVAQGLMAKELYDLEAPAVLRRLSPTTIAGYHKLAVPAVFLMRKSKLLSRFLSHGANQYAKWIVFNKPSIFGLLLRTAGEALCWTVGAVAKTIPDYRILYATPAEEMK